MNNIFKALNVKNQEEMDKLVESFDLNDDQYIVFYSSLNEDMSPEGIRFILEKVTKNFYNGSYEKLVEQYKKPTQERVLKEMPMNDEQYKKLKVGDKVKFDKPCQAPQPEEYDEIISKTDDEIKTKFRHHGGKARTICKWKPEHFKNVYSLKESTNTNYISQKLKMMIDSWMSSGDEDDKEYVSVLDDLVYLYTKLNDDSYVEQWISYFYQMEIGDDIVNAGKYIFKYVQQNSSNMIMMDNHYIYNYLNEEQLKEIEKIKQHYNIPEKRQQLEQQLKDNMYECKMDKLNEYTEVVEPKHKVGDRVVTMNKVFNWPYAASKIEKIIPPSWQDGDEAHYSYVIRGIAMDKDIGKAVVTNDRETVPVETIDTINEDTVFDHSWYEVKKQKYPKRTKDGVMCEAEEVVEDEMITDEPVEEEKPESTKDAKLAGEIEQMNQIVDTTNNPEVLNNLLQQVDAKLPLAQDTEQMNELAELKQKIETKIQTGVSINESIEYNPDDEEWFDIGDQVSFKFNTNDDIITGTVRDVKIIGGNRYYDIASYNKMKHRVENYTRIDPVGDEMHRVREPEDVIEKEEELDEMSSCGTCSTCIAQVGKNAGTIKRRARKSQVDEIENHLFKEYVLNDVPCEIELNGHKMKFFENEGKWYMSVDNALVKTFDKNVMMETADEINYNEPITADLLEGYSCYEMNILMEDGDNEFNNNAEDDVLANVLSSGEKTLDPEQNQQIKNQNKATAKEMNLKAKGQNVQLLDPKTSLEKDVKFIDGDEDDGIGYIQDEQGKVSEVPMNLLKTKG